MYKRIHAGQLRIPKCELDSCALVFTDGWTDPGQFISVSVKRVDDT